MPGEPIKYPHNYGGDLVETKADDELPKSTTIFDDPLDSFEKYPWRELTDFHAWMTYSREVREKKVRAMVKGKDTDRRGRNMLFVIFSEWARRDSGGSSDVAALAFRGLFPNHNAS